MTDRFESFYTSDEGPLVSPTYARLIEAHRKLVKQPPLPEPRPGDPLEWTRDRRCQIDIRW